ncbi:MAG: shikimate kinase [Thermoplasmata archaeon]
MHGVAETTAALTIVNVLPTGIGSAVGIDLKARAEVELHPAGSHGKWSVHVAPADRTPLIIASLAEALRQFAPGSSGTGELTLRSAIPPARGLKSSSAVSSAVVLAVARATDAPVGPMQVARLSAAVSRSVGVSATGALDDALAGLSTGVVVTDNRRDELLASYPLTSGLAAAIYIGPVTHRPSPEWVAAFGAEAARGRSAVDLAIAGEWAAAMEANSELVERVIGYDYSGLRAELHRRGAVASGVSGMGPALAAVAPPDRLSEILRAFPGDAADRRTLSFSEVSAFDGGDVG